jgi:multidrug efflux pump subunit AcrB
MFSKFFINRPIFATVLALLIVVAGLVTLNILPVAQFPEITPPTVQVSAVYPGNCATGNILSVTRPATTISRARTVANIGRLIKNLENIMYRFKSSLSTTFSQGEGAESYFC